MADKKPVNHLDANESVFFKRQLEFVKGRTYDEKLADLKYQMVLPVSAECPEGANEITWRSFSGVGLARIVSDYAKDFPRTDIGGEEHTVKVKYVGSSYAYSLLEIRRAAYAGADLTSKRALMARRAVEEKLNSLAWDGDVKAGVQGFIKYPGTTEYTVPTTGTGTTKTWSTKTAAQILTDLNGLKNAVMIGTSGKETINQILLPIAQYDLIKNTLIGTASDTTVYEFFVRNNPGIAIDWVRELDGAGTLATDMMIGYRKDAEHLTFEVPNAFEQLDEEHEGLSYEVPCMASCAGVIVYYPQSIAWGEGI
jgi:hypothetical protein